MRRSTMLAVAGAVVWLATAAAAQKPPEVALPPVIPLPPPEPLPGADAPATLDGPQPQPSTVACAPTGLFRTTIRNISPGIAASDPRAQPRQLHRQGSLFLRSSGQPQPNGSQPVVVVAEPDVWAYDAATRTGRHTVDPGPDLVVKAPILPPSADLPPELRALEFGCEPEFVAQHTPEPQQTINWGGARAGLHVYASGVHSVAVLMDVRRSGPLMLSYLRAGRPVFVIRYDDYRRNLPERPDLFQRPKNVKITEGPSQPPPLPLD